MTLPHLIFTSVFKKFGVSRDHEEVKKYSSEEKKFFPDI